MFSRSLLARAPSIALSCFVAFTLFGAHACGTSDANPGARDASANDANASNTSDAADATSTSNNDDPCDAHIRYVAHTQGLDSNDGCSPGYAKSTIKSALDSLRQANLDGYEIHVCAGNYDEAPITIDFPVSVLGSYDCGTFELPANYGAPTFEGITSNLLPPASSAGGATTVLVTGSTVDNTSTLDGFQITAADSSGASAIHVTAGATPALSNLVVAGGAGAQGATGGTLAYAPGSIGILVDQNAGPLLTNLQVAGGSGTSAAKGAVGSVAIYVENAGEFFLTGNTIDGGSGQGTAIGSAGVIVNAPPTSAGASEISQSQISGGTGKSDVTASLGVLLLDPRVKLNDAAIDGGAGTCVNAGASCTITAVSVNAPRMLVSNNRILAAKAGNPVAPSSTGILVFSPSTTSVSVDGEILLNMIEPAHGITSGIAIENVNGISILANTIAATSAETNSYGVILQNSSGSAISGNLIAAATGIYLAAPGTDACPTIASVDHNGFVVSGATLHADAACNIPDAMTITDFAAATNSSTNVRVGETCTPDSATTCVSGCASHDACMLLVFENDPSPSGLFATGFSPADAMPCLFVNGGISSTAVPEDMYGVARAGTPTIGAAVSTTQTCP